jgi:hypothetical protein
MVPGARIDTLTMIGNRRLLNTITRTQSTREMWRCQLLQLFPVFFFGSYSQEATRRRAPELPTMTRSRCDVLTWCGSNISACRGERKTESHRERSTTQNRPLLHSCMHQQTKCEKQTCQCTYLHDERADSAGVNIYIALLLIS